MALYLVAYDVPDDRRRGRVAKKLKSFGERVQYSLFECDLDGKALLRMRRAVEGALDFSEDRLQIIPLCGACAERRIRRGPALTPEDDLAVWLV